MKHKFHFDKATGTMVPDDGAVQQALKANVRKDITESQTTANTQKPVFKEEKKIEVKSPTNINIQQNQVVQLQRVNRPTALQLVDEKGMPETYLDPITVGINMFRDRLDYDIIQIIDERTGKVLAYIGGYALQVNFNMSELKTMEKIEQCLQGLVKVFRHKIMTQTLGEDKTDDKP